MEYKDQCKALRIDKHVIGGKEIVVKISKVSGILFKFYLKKHNIFKFLKAKRKKSE